MVTCNTVKFYHLRTYHYHPLILFTMYYHSNFVFDFDIAMCGMCYWYGLSSVPLIFFAARTDFCLHFRLDLLRLNKGHCCHTYNILRLFKCIRVFFFFTLLDTCLLHSNNVNTNESLKNTSLSTELTAKQKQRVFLRLNYLFQWYCYDDSWFWWLKLNWSLLGTFDCRN